MNGEFLVKLKAMLEGKESTVGGLKEIQTAAQQLSKTKLTPTFDKTGLATGKQIEETFTKIKDSTGGAVGKMGDFEKAIRRVMIVAPVWMLFRAGIQFVTQGLQEGISYLIAFEKEMVLLNQSLSGIGVGTTEINNLRESFKNLSQESGQSMATIAKAYTELIKGGADLKSAMAGTTAVTQLSEIAQISAADIAKTFAVVMKLQGDSFEGALSPMEKYNQIAHSLFVAAADNLTTVGDLSKEYTNFAASADTANLTFNQTIALLATLNSSGVQNVQGLRTGLLRLLSEIDKLAPRLGIAVNPETIKPFEVLMEVLTKIQSLSKTTGFNPEQFAVLKDLFGAGGRGGTLPISALSNALEGLKKTLGSIDFPIEATNRFNQALTETQESIPHQIEILNNLKQQMFESFVVGITGAKDFNNALMTLNQAMYGLVDNADNIGKAFFTLAHPLMAAKLEADKINQEFEDLYNKIKKAEEGSLELKDVIELITTLQERQKTTGADYSGTIDQLKEIAKDTAINAVTQERFAKIVNDWADKNINKIEEQRDKTKQLSIALQDRLILSQEEYRILTLQKSGTDDLTIAHEKLNNAVELLVERYNNLDLEKNGLKPITAMSVETAVLAGDWNKVLDIFKGMSLGEKEMTELAKEFSNVNKAILADLSTKMSRMSTILGIAGEEQSIIIQQEMAMKAMIYGEDYIKNSMDDRLKLAQALTKEADEQEKKSSHLVDLFKIYKKYGQDAAQQVSEFLGGIRKFGELSPDALRALKRTTPGEYEAGQAQQFFQGKEFKFPEEITKERIQQRNIQILQNVMVEPIQLNVNLESEDLVQRIKDEIRKEIDKIGSKLNTSVHQLIENH
jgi:TP901 family phage tail tape measure protein